ncbi:complex I 51 kDa subunit family protein [Clostridium sp. C105KSO13]|uniref:complex I 51 kDa subunit family protein n=1 Tax=Clostridium sp. C105KSO13 TaxID=1776045 RepID=UPI0007406E1D|nr:NADH-ubiquinone oxidoreductase-F iron-sulfur binding region domain-containing protein [Clostridium sp. C105KSO13]CUX51433.1 NADP-reducing hydrogenase subunit HndC [Clostridium sp. C105KSO13]
MALKEPVLLKRVGKMTDSTSVEEFTKYGGFDALKKAVTMDKETILDELDTAKLRGRGGAAYPLGRKWRHLYGSQDTPKYIVCNADEGEPGTFKDKMLLEKDPLSVVEGMLIAGYEFGSNDGYIYIRGEYRHIQAVFQQALDNARRAGYLGENIMGIDGFNYDIHIISGAGAYVCGENSALLNSIEGKTGRPRVKPPHLADVGLYLKPTLVNNVESFACVPALINMGGEAFLNLGTKDGGGTKLVCLSGHIKNRGIYEVELGTPLDEILYSEEYGGGTSTGRPIKFIHFGGQSGPIGTSEQIKGRLYDYGDFWYNKLAIGSGAIVVMDASVNIVDYMTSVMEFFVEESCGKCTPCRLGTTRLLELLRKLQRHGGKQGDIEKLEKMLELITNLSACGLGQSVSISVRSALTGYRNEFEECIS